MLKRVMIQAAYGLFLLVAGVNVVSAASIGVSPVRATLSANQKIETITVRNTGTRADVGATGGDELVSARR